MQIHKDLPGFSSKEAGIAFLIDRIRYNLRNIEINLTTENSRQAAGNIVLLSKILTDILDPNKEK